MASQPREVPSVAVAETDPAEVVACVSGSSVALLVADPPVVPARVCPVQPLPGVKVSPEGPLTHITPITASTACAVVIDTEGVVLLPDAKLWVSMTAFGSPVTLITVMPIAEKLALNVRVRVLLVVKAVVMTEKKMKPSAFVPFAADAC
jgi:hypothetical protein